MEDEEEEHVEADDGGGGRQHRKINYMHITRHLSWQSCRSIFISWKFNGHDVSKSFSLSRCVFQHVTRFIIVVLFQHFMYQNVRLVPNVPALTLCFYFVKHHFQPCFPHWKTRCAAFTAPFSFLVWFRFFSFFGLISAAFSSFWLLSVIFSLFCSFLSFLLHI